MVLKAKQMTKLGNSRPKKNIDTQSQSTTRLSNSRLRTMVLKAKQMTKLGNSRPREYIGTQGQSTIRLSN